MVRNIAMDEGAYIYNLILYNGDNAVPSRIDAGDLLNMRLLR